ncbi:MAG: type II secretion system F family protein [Nitrospirae bacterium]|nr:MAG: type II secretion system F family protein [Nitrospirota bacterium]
MAYYRYQAATLEGGSASGVAEAADPDHLYQLLRERGLYLLEAREQPPAALDRRVALSRKERLEVAHHLAVVLGAGIGILTALEDLVAHARGREREMFAAILERVRSGSDLSEALALFPRAFPEAFCSVVAAGEATGSLAERFADLAEDLEYQIELRRQVRRAVSYPLTLVAAVAGLVLLIFTFVVPRFAPVFLHAGVALPLPTRVVVAVSRALSARWPVLLGSVAALALFLVAARVTERGRMVLDRLLLATPWVGRLRAELAVAAAAHLLGLLYRAGVGILRALELTARVVPSPVYREALLAVRERVARGEPLSRAIAAAGRFPSLFQRMVEVGERTGDLDATLARANRYYRQEVPRVIERTLAVLQPLLLALLGGVVGGVALSIFLPMYRMMEVVR